MPKEQPIPLIVNTMGHVRGNAVASPFINMPQELEWSCYSISADGFNLTSLSHLEVFNFWTLFKQKCTSLRYMLCPLVASQRQSTSYNFISQCRTVARWKRNERFKNYFGKSLCSQVPYSVPWHKIRIRVLREIPPSQVMWVLNGGIVGLYGTYSEIHFQIRQLIPMNTVTKTKLQQN